MFEDDLERLIHKGIEGLSRDEELLKSMLSAVAQSRMLFQNALPSDTRGPARALGQEAQLPGLSRAVADTEAAGSANYSGYRAQFSSALSGAPLDGATSVLQMGRVCANAAGGLVPVRAMAEALIELGLTESTMTYLPGYISKKLLQSGEFSRVGKRGSGLYRWIRFEGPAADGVFGDNQCDKETIPPEIEPVS